MYFVPWSDRSFPKNARVALLVPMLVLLGACGESATLPVIAGQGPDPVLPEPNPTMIPTVNIAPAVGWPADGLPEVADGLQVNRFAQGLNHPRWLYVLPNGDVLVAESNAQPKPPRGIRGHIMASVMKEAGARVRSADRISLLRDADGNGEADLHTVLIDDLRSPIGMALVDGSLYVANTDAVVRFPFTPGDTVITAEPELVAALPAGPINHHWTKSLVASDDGSKLYVGVGSNSNAAENGMAAERGRAAILEIDRVSGSSRVFASGLRNPVGMDWQPDSGELWGRR